MQSFEETLSSHEARVDGLLKQCSQLAGALKGWKRACGDGAVGDRQKHADRAQALSSQIGPAAQEVSAEWTFDTRGYLSSDAWQNELIEAAERHPSALRVFVETGELVCSPVVLKAEPARACLRIGKARWPKLRPRKVVDELVRLRERGAKQNVQEFLDALHSAVEYSNRGKEQKGNTISAKLRDVYDLFSLTPGWKKENSTAAFAQYLYALHQSDIRVTRSGKMYEFGFVSGHPPARDLFEVVAEDGRPLKYYLIHFR